MGYGVIPEHGEPWCCEVPCDHTDCAAFRRDFIEDSKCHICGKELKPGDRFYYIEHGGTAKVHSLCEMERVS